MNQKKNKEPEEYKCAFHRTSAGVTVTERDVNKNPIAWHCSKCRRPLLKTQVIYPDALQARRAEAMAVLSREEKKSLEDAMEAAPIANEAKVVDGKVESKVPDGGN